MILISKILILQDTALYLENRALYFLFCSVLNIKKLFVIYSDSHSLNAQGAGPSGNREICQVFSKRSCLWIILGIHLNDCMSSNKLLPKCGSFPSSRAIMKERVRWPGYVLGVKDKILQNIFVFGNLSWPNEKHFILNEVARRHEERYKGNWNFMGEVKSEILKILR